MRTVQLLLIQNVAPSLKSIPTAFFHQLGIIFPGQGILARKLLGEKIKLIFVYSKFYIRILSKSN